MRYFDREDEIINFNLDEIRRLVGTTGEHAKVASSAPRPNSEFDSDLFIKRSFWSPSNWLQAVCLGGLWVLALVLLALCNAQRRRPLTLRQHAFADSLLFGYVGTSALFWLWICM